MKKSTLKHIIKQLVKEQLRNLDEKIAVEPDKGPIGPGPDTGCEGIPQECPEGQTFSFDTCKCEGRIAKDPMKGPKRRGCTDENALNYDEFAQVDDDSCEYPEGYFGCIDPIALNYDEDAVANDGSCEYNEGCMDNSALNYNEDAVVDDGSCEYPWWEGDDCCSELDIAITEYESMAEDYTYISETYVDLSDSLYIVNIEPIQDILSLRDTYCEESNICDWPASELSPLQQEWCDPDSEEYLAQYTSYNSSEWDMIPGAGAYTCGQLFTVAHYSARNSRVTFSDGTTVEGNIQYNMNPDSEGYGEPIYSYGFTQGWGFNIEDSDD